MANTDLTTYLTDKEGDGGNKYITSCLLFVFLATAGNLTYVRLSSQFQTRNISLVRQMTMEQLFFLKYSENNEVLTARKEQGRETKAFACC